MGNGADRKVQKDRVFALTGYTPHLGQEPVHNCDARFRVIIAGRRWGKSLSAAKEAEVMLLTPNTRGWVVSKTYDLTMKVIREIEIDFGQKLRIKPSKRQMSGPFILEYENGSTMEGKSAEHPESLLGEGLDWLIFDEAAQCKQVVWEQYLRPTLTDREGWALFITTPKGYNWIYDLWERGNDPKHPEWQSFRSPSWENPKLNQADIDEAKSTLAEAIFLQEYGASFTRTSGQVYPEFQADTHVYDPEVTKIPKAWPRYRMIDWGYSDPFVCLWAAVDGQDRIYIYEDYWQEKKSLKKIAKYLVKQVSKRNKDQKEIRQQGQWMIVNRNNHIPYGDSDKTDYQWSVADAHGAGRGNMAEFGEYGIPCFGYTQDIETGLDEVRDRLALRDPGELPGLVVSRRCSQTIKEFNLYEYPDVPGKNAGELPLDANNHAMDAIRYFAMALRGGGISQQRPRLG